MNNNKKQMTLSIVTVLAVMVLVAGGTYAWLTSQLAVTNGNYNTRSMNFVVNYTNGNALNSLPTLSSPTPSTAAKISVTAGLAATSTPGDLTIYLNSNVTGLTEQETALITSGAINYAVCINGVDTCTEDFSSVPAAQKGVVNSTANSGKLAILSGSQLQYTTRTYDIYLWLDGSKITNAMASANASYSGFISAEAVQVETRPTPGA